jgi:hypothetical protein
MNKLDIVRKIVNDDTFISILNTGYVNIHINIISITWNTINDIEMTLNDNIDVIQKMKYISSKLYKTFSADKDTFKINIKNNILSISFSLHEINFI